jgi:signal transduction histidine kinase/ligand-binding sensor domain-containing protein
MPTLTFSFAFSRVKSFIQVLLISILFFNENVVRSQTLKIDFEKFNIDHGLSQNTIYTIIQDSKGYMWFGTEDGLNRFDGYNFNVFMPSKDDSKTLSNSRIFALHEDPKKNIWIGTLGGGLNRYDYESQSFYSYTNIAGDKESISSNVIMSITSDSTGNLLVGTAGGGLSIYNPETGKFTSYTNNAIDSKSIPGNLVRSILVSSNGLIFIGTDKGLAIFDNLKGEFSHISSEIGSTNPVLFRTVLAIAQEDENTFWISAEDNGIVRINLKEKTINHFITQTDKSNSLANNTVLDIYIDNTKTAWLATYDGLQSFDINSNNFRTFRSNPLNPYSISSNLIRCIYEDNAGILWIGSYRDGINKFNKKYQKFITIRNQTAVDGNLPNSSIRAVCEDNFGNILIGTYGNGLVKININTYESIINPYREISSFDESLRYVTSIVSGINSTLWIGFDGAGLVHFNQKNSTIKRFSSLKSKNDNIIINRIRCLTLDKQNNIWIGTTGEGAVRLCTKTNNFSVYKPNPNEPNTSLSQERIICIYEDLYSNIWIGTSSEGINLLNQRTGKITQYKNRLSDSISISSNRVLTVFQDKKERLWIGTSAGLNLFDYDTRTFKSFFVKDGLPNDVIYGILEDDTGVLWLSTNKGICSFDYNPGVKPIIKSFTKLDGLQSNEFTEGAYTKLGSGKLVFGGIGGISVFNPLDIKTNPIAPAVHIEKISYFSNANKKGQREVNSLPVFGIEKLILPYHQNNITLQFVALHFANPKNNIFKYKLVGFDTEWISPELGQRFATYTNLKPGEYTFNVIAASSDGIWNEEGAKLLILIKPPFWLTWWFITAISISLIFSVLLAIRLRTASLLKTQKILEEKVKTRTNEILKQKEEIEGQRNYLSELNAELYQKNEEITAQHEELEKAQRQIVQSEKMASIGVLTAGIAHEINNPINFVYAGVNSVIRDFQDIDQVLYELIGVDEKSTDGNQFVKKIKQKMAELDFEEAYKAIKQTLTDIKLGAERTAEIVEGLRNFSRTDNEQWTASDINSIIDGVLVLLKNKYKNRIELIKQFDNNIPLIDCRRGRINQVLMNIISNAIDAIADKGEIKIRTYTKKGMCLISISDTGVGIEEFLIDKIFDPFFTTKQVGKGVGLGLSISYGIIQEHNGNITVTSEKGKGTVFTIEIPIKQKSS